MVLLFCFFNRDAKRRVRLWGLGGRREPDQDTLSLRVARSGTKVAATVIRILASHDLITMSAT